MCNLPDYPIEVQGAVSGMFHNNQYVCGGNFPYTPQCFNPLTGEEAPFNLLHDRGFASSVTIKNEFYIFGGGGESTNLDSYEVISKENGQSEGQIPFLFASGCAVAINSTTVMLIGGVENIEISTKTWLFNIQEKEWTQGPSMNEERFLSGCGFMEGTQNIAVFGGFPGTATAEILKLPGGRFKLSKSEWAIDIDS